MTAREALDAAHLVVRGAERLLPQHVDQAEAEIDNLRAAFAWSRDTADGERALQLASALRPLWLTRGRVGLSLASY